jgi:hypothetical protein
MRSASRSRIPVPRTVKWGAYSTAGASFVHSEYGFRPLGATPYGSLFDSSTGATNSGKIEFECYGSMARIQTSGNDGLIEWRSSLVRPVAKCNWSRDCSWDGGVLGSRMESHMERIFLGRVVSWLEASHGFPELEGYPREKLIYSSRSGGDRKSAKSLGAGGVVVEGFFARPARHSPGMWLLESGILIFAVSWIALERSSSSWKPLSTEPVS